MSEDTIKPLEASDLMQLAHSRKPIPHERALATYALKSNWVQLYQAVCMRPDYEAKACEWGFIGPVRPPYELAQCALAELSTLRAENERLKEERDNFKAELAQLERQTIAANTAFNGVMKQRDQLRAEREELAGYLAKCAELLEAVPDAACAEMADASLNLLLSLEGRGGTIEAKNVIVKVQKGKSQEDYPLAVVLREGLLPVTVTIHTLGMEQTFLVSWRE